MTRAVHRPLLLLWFAGGSQTPRSSHRRSVASERREIPFSRSPPAAVGVSSNSSGIGRGSTQVKSAFFLSLSCLFVAAEAAALALVVVRL